jgi:hypothetical protein
MRKLLSVKMKIVAAASVKVAAITARPMIPDMIAHTALTINMQILCPRPSTSMKCGPNARLP